MSGPLLDRIDLHVQVPSVRWSELGELAPGPDTASVREQVARARALQAARAAEAGARTNARIPDGRLDGVAPATAAARALLAHAVDAWGFSARAVQRALRVARTIADLAACPGLDEVHVAEALSYRRLQTRGSSPTAG